MKKILITIGLTLATSAAFAQGFINFSPSALNATTNTSISPLFGGTGTGGVGGTTVLAGNGFYYTLLIQHYTGTVATDTAVWDGSWKSSGIVSSNAPSGAQGRIVAQGTTINTGTLVGWNSFANGGSTFPNGTNSIVLVGWSSNLGGDWLTASNNLANWNTLQGNFSGQNAFFGETGFGWENPNSSGTGIAVLGAGANAGGQPIVIANGITMYLMPVPEPTTLALAGLGGLAMLMIRRRK